MNDLLMIGLFLFAWFAMARWVLPAMGIQTCMSGGCCGNSCEIPTSRSATSESENTGDNEEAPAAK